MTFDSLNVDNLLNNIDTSIIQSTEIPSSNITSGEMTGDLFINKGFIRSKDYVSGSAGWSINDDGTAEFSDVTVRGTIYATAGEITGSITLIADSADAYISAGKTDFWARLTMCDGDCSFTCTNTTGDTWRYTFIANYGSGADPDILGDIAIGDIVNFVSTNFDDLDNNGIFTVTGVGLNYFDVTNASGNNETEHTISFGVFEMGKAGFILGVDYSDSEKSKFFIGNYDKYLNWDGNTFYIKGSLESDDFHYMTIFESLDGFQVGGNGGGSASISSNGMAITTNAGATDYEYVTKEMASLAGLNLLTWDLNRHLRLTFSVNSVTEQTIYICCGKSEANHEKIGFYINDQKLYGVSGNGTTDTARKIKDISLGTYYLVEAKFYAGDRCEFYLNNDLITTMSTVSKLPSGNNFAERILYPRIRTDNGDAKTLNIQYWDFWQEY